MKTFHESTTAYWRSVGAIMLMTLASVAQAGSGNGKGPPIGKNDGSNLPPTISGDPAKTAIENQLYDFTPVASDPEGAQISFYISNRPSWATFDRTTGRLAGTPAAADVGTSWSVTIEAADRWNRTPLGPFMIVVQSSSGTTLPPANLPPEISGTPPTAVHAGASYGFRPLASDPNGDPLRFGIRNQPTWASFNSATGELTGSPTDAAAGTYSNIEISVSDGQASAALPVFAISVVADANTPPGISGSPPRAVTAGQTYAFQPSATDPDGDPLSFMVRNKPAWASFSAGNGSLTGTPPESAVGTYTDVEISVTDGESTAALSPFAIEVMAEPNTPPVITGSPASSVTAGTAYSFRPSASDADGDPLTFSIRNKPTWASFSASNGQLSGTPSDSAAGVYSGIEISVSDGSATAALSAFTIEVLAEPNSAPVISGSPARSVTAGTAYSFRPSASDADGDLLGFSIRNKPAWASFSTSSGALSGTPPESAAGVHSGIEISVSDGEATAALPSFSIEVLAPTNEAPVIAGSPNGAVTVGQAYSFSPTASDPDQDPLSFAIQGKPSWASFSTSTGRLSGTPTAGDVGRYANIVISVSDGKASASLPAFAIDVEQISTNSVTLSWQPPTENSDGTPLTDLAGYKICYGQNSSSLAQSIDLMNPGLTSAVIENLAAGTWYFAVKAKNSAGVESGYSNMASKTFP